VVGSDFATAGRTIIGPNVGQIRSAAINLSQLSNCLRLVKNYAGVYPLNLDRDWKKIFIDKKSINIYNFIQMFVV